MTGVLFGLAVGIAFRKHHPLAYPLTKIGWFARALLGNAGLVAMFETIAALTPKEPLAVYNTLRFVKYMMIPIYIIYLGPWAFELVGM